ncbi:MAG: hypothetical protein Q8M16_20535, partial [Pirellulaceae bacterium]|nr:hypothetical protein [Pirellulaceae bacterium]
ILNRFDAVKKAPGSPGGSFRLLANARPSRAEIPPGSRSVDLVFNSQPQAYSPPYEYACG